VRLLAEPMRSHPTAFTHALAAVDMVVTGLTEIAITGDRSDMVTAVQAAYLPNAVLAWGEPYPSPLWEGRADNMAYVCRNYACLAPVDDPAALLAELGS
jgi:uncharacterized protein